MRGQTGREVGRRLDRGRLRRSEARGARLCRGGRRLRTRGDGAASRSSRSGARVEQGEMRSRKWRQSITAVPGIGIGRVGGDAARGDSSNGSARSRSRALGPGAASGRPASLRASAKCTRPRQKCHAQSDEITRAADSGAVNERVTGRVAPSPLSRLPQPPLPLALLHHGAMISAKDFAPVQRDFTVPRLQS